MQTCYLCVAPEKKKLPVSIQGESSAFISFLPCFKSLLR